MEHISVMLETTVSMLNITGDGIYVDGTLGRAGHSSEILKRLTTGHLYSFDIDQQAIDESREKLERINNNFTLIKANFADMQDELNSRSIYQVDGVLLDIGVSSPQ
ncbi:MAG: 16S rRNA (cytosine(1402)-N(4))-methyltransferase, partial [Erysipelotrichaceae bacterium]|nr:16S rRNA (cytosine(1402)-N(4))-methyltransferase [Erysipelotrichaceae bacterium]